MDYKGFDIIDAQCKHEEGEISLDIRIERILKEMEYEGVNWVHVAQKLDPGVSMVQTVVGIRLQNKKKLRNILKG